MAKPRKMLADINAPYLRSLMRIMETQSKVTIANWCIAYADTHILPLWQGSFPEDNRPAAALDAARDYLAGRMTLPEAKKHITECRKAAREAEGSLIPQGAARAIDTAASAIHNSAGALGIALYGSLTMAYKQVGIAVPWETLEPLAATECQRMEAALRAIAVENEPNPVKIKWNC